MEFLWFSSKLIVSLAIVTIAVAMIILVVRSKQILQILQIADGAIHGASAAILTQGSMLAMILPLVIKDKSKSNIWTTIFKLTPLAKDKRIERLIKPVTNITESIVELVKKN